MTLTKEEKRIFIEGLTSAITIRLVSKIDDMPEEWDGFELRQIIADTFADSVYMQMSRSRKRAYKNDVLVYNL